VNFYVSMDELYQKVDSQLESFEGNPCGDCNSCCTTTHIREQKVSPLEFDYLEKNVGKEKTDRFRSYVSRARGADGELLFTVCPNHSENQCSVHPFRPYSCRLYGQFRADSEPLIAHCAFRDTVKVVPKAQEKDHLPGSRELQNLMVDYALHYSEVNPTRSSSSATAQTENMTFLELGTFQLSQGLFQEAVSNLEAAVKSESTALGQWLLGQAYEGVDQNAAAEAGYRMSIAMQKGNPRFHLYLGNLLMKLGRYEEAQHPLRQALELDPNLSLAAGVLGFVYAQLGDIESAINAYEVCLSKETEPTVFRLQLGLLYREKGLEERAVLLLEAARECEYTKADAEAALLGE
jgi:Tfp pilus assembly protein PilF/Fe-S-cluster containining protein